MLNKTQKQVSRRSLKTELLISSNQKRKSKMPNDIQRNYTRIIGVYFLLITLTLIWDFYSKGYRPETWHKLFHIFLGVIIIKNWKNRNFYKPFSLFAGLFFLFVASFGFAFPDFASPYLDAFSTTDTFLHAIVGIFGVGAYFSDRIRV